MVFFSIHIHPLGSSGFKAVIGDDYANECPDNTFLLSEAECKTVPSQITGTTWGRTGDWSTSPIGCYRYSDDKIYYNKAERGSSTTPSWKPICGRRMKIFITTSTAHP